MHEKHQRLRLPLLGSVEAMEKAIRDKNEWWWRCWRRKYDQEESEVGANPFILWSVQKKEYS